MASRRQRVACLFLLELFRWCAISQIAAYYLDPDIIKKTVDDHNKFRSQVNPPAANMRHMSWDPELAEIAGSWARECRSYRNPSIKRRGLHYSLNSIGENICTSDYNKPLDPIKQWVEPEIGNYDPFRKRCTTGKKCDNYTQVVWADSYKIGCGSYRCETVEGVGITPTMHFVCNYGPAGNNPGRAPYTAGASCSQCRAGDTCVDKLCRNKNRDGIPVPTVGGPGGGAPDGGKPGGGTKKKTPSFGLIPKASYGGTLFVMLIFHTVVFMLTQFMA